MKCGIVKASALVKARRWDAEYFLGDRPVLAGEVIAQKEKQVREAQARLDAAKAEQAATKARVDGFIADGSVKPIE